jgi:predicted anti-sigma-YlaC factor YlaD
MKCKAAQEMLSRYLDNEMSSDDRNSVAAHLAQCPACQVAYADQQRLWGLLGRVEPVQPPDVIAAVEARLLEHRGWVSFLPGLRLRTVGYAAAAMVLVGLSVWAGIWAGTSRHKPAARENDRIINELLTDTPPGMEIVALLDEIGDRP